MSGKRRNRDPLGENSHEKRRKIDHDKENYILDNRDIVITRQKLVKATEKAKLAANVKRELRSPPHETHGEYSNVPKYRI